MQSKPIPELIGQTAFEAPIPGQSLTNSPDADYAWKKQPEMVDIKQAREKIFLNLLEPDKLQEIQKLMMNEVPVDAIAQTMLVEGFRQGKFNPDLALQLLEPTMYMLLAIAERSGIKPTLDIEDEEPDEEESEEIINQSKTLMKAIDLTNAKYGRNAISIAQAGINNDWKMRKEHSSRIDTASFDFLPEISV